MRSPSYEICIFIPPANEVAGVYSDPYVRPFVRFHIGIFQHRLQTHNILLMRVFHKSIINKGGGGTIMDI